MKKLLLASAMLTMAAGVQAGEVTGTPTLASADIVIGQPAVVTHSLTAVSNLQAVSLPDGTTIANGVVGTLSGTPAQLAYRFQIPDNTGRYDSTQVQPDSGSGTELKLKLVADAAAPATYNITDNYLVTDTTVVSAKYSVALSGTQTPSAGTYTVKTMASIYTP